MGHRRKWLCIGRCRVPPRGEQVHRTAMDRRNRSTHRRTAHATGQLFETPPPPVLLAQSPRGINGCAFPSGRNADWIYAIDTCRTVGCPASSKNSNHRFFSDVSRRAETYSDSTSRHTARPRDCGKHATQMGCPLRPVRTPTLCTVAGRILGTRNTGVDAADSSRKQDCSFLAARICVVRPLCPCHSDQYGRRPCSPVLHLVP